MKEIIYTHWMNRDISDIEGEIWKFIQNTNERYSVSNFGRVKSNRVLNSINGDSIFNTYPFILKQYKDKADDLRVCITYIDKIKHEAVPFLVCSSFHDNPENNRKVNRLINVRTYNHESNLKWANKIEIRETKKLNANKSYEVVDIIRPDNSLFDTKKSAQGKSFIYGITNELGDIVYIGKSRTPIQRFRQHKTWARNPKFVVLFNLEWLKDILDKGTPTLIILKEIDSIDWEKWEKYFIAHYKSKGNILYNISIGGHEMTVNTIKAFTSANEKRKIPILQCDLQGNIVHEWESTCLAAYTLNIPKQGITRCLKKKRPTSHGYKWLYK